MDQTLLHKTANELTILIEQFNPEVADMFLLTEKLIPFCESDVAKVLRFKDRITAIDTKIELLIAEWVVLSIQNKEHTAEEAACLNTKLTASAYANYGLDNDVWENYKTLLQFLIIGAFPYNPDAYQKCVNEFDYLYNEDPEKNRERIIEIAEVAKAMEQKKQRYINFLKSWYGENYLETLQSTNIGETHLVQ